VYLVTTPRRRHDLGGRIGRPTSTGRKQREDYRAWLGIVAALEPRFDGDAEGWSLPDEVYETLGPPRWTILEPHGPPHR
jgi:hypothetical protein